MPEVPKTKLFISHATEDNAFAEPLVEGLIAKGFETWFDKTDLRASESLLGIIGAALNTSDYGVCIFSKNYFLKKWTLGEMDGLYALETATRKMIIPVWLDVSEADVKRVFPMLAGRRGIPTNNGMDQVVHEIQQAVILFDRHKRLLSPIEEMKARIQHVVKVTKEDEYSRRSLSGIEGTQRVLNALRIAFDSAEATVKELGALQPGWQVKANVAMTAYAPKLFIVGPYDLSGDISVVGLAQNDAGTAKAIITIRRSQHDSFGRYVSSKTLKTTELSPYIASDDVVTWFDDKESIRNSSLHDYLLAGLVNEVSKRGLEGKRPK